MQSDTVTLRCERSMWAQTDEDDFEVDGSVQALKDAMMAAYTEEGGESAHQQNDEL